MKATTIIEMWPLNLCLLLCYISEWPKRSDPQNIILMKYSYNYVNFENLCIQKVLQFCSGKCISKTCLFHVKHLAWIRKGPGPTKIGTDSPRSTSLERLFVHLVNVFFVDSVLFHLADITFKWSYACLER